MSIFGPRSSKFNVGCRVQPANPHASVVYIGTVVEVWNSQSADPWYRITWDNETCNLASGHIWWREDHLKFSLSGELASEARV